MNSEDRLERAKKKIALAATINEAISKSGETDVTVIAEALLVALHGWSSPPDRDWLIGRRE